MIGNLRLFAVAAFIVSSASFNADAASAISWFEGSVMVFRGDSVIAADVDLDLADGDRIVDRQFAESIAGSAREAIEKQVEAWEEAGENELSGTGVERACPVPIERV